MIERKLIDPKQIKQEDLVLIVFAQDTRSVFNFLTAWRTTGWGHVMVMHRLGYLATQVPTGYREVPIETYLKKGIILKFWRVKGLTPVGKQLFDKLIREDLKKPWWKRRYDFLGLFGQALPFKWGKFINSPWAQYCSEKVGGYLRKVKHHPISLHPSPEELDAMFESLPEDYELYGYIYND